MNVLIINIIRKDLTTPDLLIWNLGGNHYAERFTRRALDENMAFGHIIPAYQFSVLSPEVLKQAKEKFEKTLSRF